MRILILSAITVFMLACSAANARVIAIPDNPGIPEISYSQAISEAEKYIASKELNVSRHFLASIEYNFNSGLPSFWRLEWRLRNAFVEGGQVIVDVPVHGEVTHSFGE